jgi:hypothetical protein
VGRLSLRRLPLRLRLETLRRLRWLRWLLPLLGTLPLVLSGTLLFVCVLQYKGGPGIGPTVAASTIRL